MSLLYAIGVLLATTILDIVCVFYVRRTTAGLAHQAAIYASLIVILNALVVFSYFTSPMYVIPAIIGTYIGTYIAVKLDSK